MKSSQRIITVRVTPNARKESVEEIGPDSFKVKVNVPPEKGRANERAAKLISERLDVPLSRISLVKGDTSRDKVFAIRG